MYASEILENLKARGYEWMTQDGTIYFRPALPDEDLARVKAHKPALLELLTAAPPPVGAPPAPTPAHAPQKPPVGRPAAKTPHSKRVSTAMPPAPSETKPTAPTTPLRCASNDPATFGSVVGLTAFARASLTIYPFSAAMRAEIMRTGGWLSIRLESEMFVPELSASEQALYVALLNGETDAFVTVQWLGREWFEQRKLPVPVALESNTLTLHKA